MRKRWRHVGILSALIFLLTLVAINYVVSRFVNRADYPFNLPADARVFTVDDAGAGHIDSAKVAPSELISLDKFQDVTIIATDDDWNYAAIYDSAFRYARNLQMISPGEIRYFSENDYQTRSPVSAVVVHEPLLGPLDWLYAALEENSFGYQYLFTIDASSELYQNDIDEVRNLTSLDTWGDTLFLIPSEHNSVNRDIADFLSDIGYQESGLMDLSSSEIVYYSLKSGFKEQYFFTIAVSQYLLFCFVVNSLFIREKRTLKLHWLSGGTSGTILKYFAKTFNLACLIPDILMIIGFTLMKNSHFFNSIGWSDFILFFVLHLVILNLIFIISFMINFAHAEKLNVRSV